MTENGKTAMFGFVVCGPFSLLEALVSVAFRLDIWSMMSIEVKFRVVQRFLKLMRELWRMVKMAKLL